MNIFVIVIASFLFLHTTRSEEVRLLDLDPKDAQQIIEQKDQTLHYAPKIESNVPAVRFLGNEPHNVQEDIYLANQYHGQDGIGGYLYGYSVPDIAKTEKKKAGGDLRGAYNYIAGNGQEIQVRYWDDGTGFHQEDNLPKVLPQQIDDTPEVKAAKEEHYRIWHEQAERNSRPVQSPYDASGHYAQGPLSPQGQLQRQQQQLVSQYQQQKQHFPNPGQSVHYQGEQPSQYLGQQSQNVNRYQATNQFGGGAGGKGQISTSGHYDGVQPSGSGQIGRQVSAVSGQHGGVQPSGSGHFGGSQSALTGSSSSSSSSSGPFGGIQSGSGQYGGVQPSTGSGQFGVTQSSGSSQYGGVQPSGSGQFAGSQSAGGNVGFGGKPSTGGQIGGSAQFGGSGQYGGENVGFGGKPSSGGQIGGSGQYGSGSQSAGLGQFTTSSSSQYSGSGGSGSGQYSASGYSSGGGQYSGSHSSGQYSGSDEERKWDENERKWDEEEGKWDAKEEEQGPPRGFFYNFDYPVGIIVSKDGGAIQKREGDLKDIYATNKANFEKQVQQGSGSSAGYLAV